MKVLLSIVVLAALAVMPLARTSYALPTTEKCFGTVMDQWDPPTLLCNNPCIPSGCTRKTHVYDPTPGSPGDEIDVKICVCQGGTQVCCDVGMSYENGLLVMVAFGSCNGTTCPSGSCGLVVTEEDVSADCD